MNEGVLGLLQNAGAPSDGTTEIQTITVAGAPNGGTYKLSFRGLITASIAFDADAATVQTALRALGSIGASGIGVAGNAGGPYTATFAGDLDKLALELIALDTNALTGNGDETVTIVAAQEGVDATGRGSQPGAILIDTTNGDVYKNGGTAYAPVWTELAATAVSYGAAGEMAAAGTSTANAAGVTAKSARIDHVHALGAHDHSGATKGAQIGKTAFAADAFTADADGRAPFEDGIWTTAKLAVGVISADADGRALFAAGVIDAATAESIFADNSIPSDKMNWGFTADDPTTISADDVAAAGASGHPARADHTHGIVCAAPADGSLAAANAEGGATSFARSDHAHRAVVLDAVELEFGTSYDAVMGWEQGDADNHTLVLGLADANQALHVVDKSAIATDFNVVADAHPSLYIHSDTTPATDYLKLYHDATSGYLQAVGGSLVLTGVGEVVVNEASADVNLRVEGANVENLLFVDAGLDTVAFGAVGAASGFVLVASTARTLASAAEYAALSVVPGAAVTTAGDASSSDYIASVYLKEPNITNGGGDTITVAATLYIADAPTEGATNSALYIASGTLDPTGGVRFGVNPASAGYIRVPNNSAVWAARNQANGADISGWKVNAQDDYEAGADVNLGSNKLYGSTADNGDLDLNATSSATVATAYIIARQMVDATAGSVAVLMKAGAPGDGDFGQTAIDGLIAIDTTNHRLYFREGGDWHYIDKDDA